MPEHVNQLKDEPIVGKFYLVPCIVGFGGWTPVIGTEHEDAEIIGVPKRHYHRDLRFLSQKEVRRSFFFTSARVTALVTYTPEQRAMTAIETNVADKPIDRRMRCLRRMPDFPVAIFTLPAPWLSELENVYSRASAKCGKCPHKGTPLNGLPVKDGKVICPSHGLQWDVLTGELVRRV